MFAAMAERVEARWQVSLRDIDRAILNPEFAPAFQAELPGFHALIRNTCSITMLTGSQKINVVPPTASAELDCRILPDQNADEFLEGIRDRIADEQIAIEEIMLFGAAASSSDTPLYSLLVAKTLERFPAAGIVPAVATGFTDSHFFRDIGISSYGYNPSVRSELQRSTVHGNNERIGIDTFNRAVGIMTEILETFTTN